MEFITAYTTIKQDTKLQCAINLKSRIVFFESEDSSWFGEANLEYNKDTGYYFMFGDDTIKVDVTEC